MNKKKILSLIFAVGSFVAIGVSTAVIENAQVESENEKGTVAVVGIVDLDNVTGARTAVGSIFCLHLSDQEKKYTDCIEQQSKMFSRRLSSNGAEPTSHYASGWYWGESQYEVFTAAYNEQTEFEFKFSTSKTFEEMMTEESLKPVEESF